MTLLVIVCLFLALCATLLLTVFTVVRLMFGNFDPLFSIEFDDDIPEKLSRHPQTKVRK